MGDPFAAPSKIVFSRLPQNHCRTGLKWGFWTLKNRLEKEPDFWQNYFVRGTISRVFTVLASLACLIGAFLVGCTTMSVPKKQLSSEDFLRLYDNPGTPGDYWEYEGLKDGRYWLYHYGFKQPQQSVVSVMEKGFVDAVEMPAGFPSAPQPKPRPADSTDVNEVLEKWRKEIDARSQKTNQ
jgi:hypothetical protein